MEKYNTLIVACFGDSITKGRFSYDWVNQLSKAFAKENIDFLNFGTDGHMAYNALQSVEKVIESEPDFVFILIGTNDVYAVLSESNTKRYMRSLGLPKRPSIEWYSENLEKIILQLIANTSAKIAVFTLPVMGEDMNHVANKTVKKYNDEISRLAQLYEIELLNLGLEMADYLNENPPNPTVPLSDGLGMIVKAALRKYLLFQDWDTISKTNGFVLTTDGIHLNSISGKMMSDLAKEFIQANS